MRIEDVPEWVLSPGSGAYSFDPDRQAILRAEHDDLKSRQRTFLDGHGLSHIRFLEVHNERRRRAGLLPIGRS